MLPEACVNFLQLGQCITFVDLNRTQTLSARSLPETTTVFSHHSSPPLPYSNPNPLPHHTPVSNPNSDTKPRTYPPPSLIPCRCLAGPALREWRHRRGRRTFRGRRSASVARASPVASLSPCGPARAERRCARGWSSTASAWRGGKVSVFGREGEGG